MSNPTLLTSLVLTVSLCLGSMPLYASETETSTYTHKVLPTSLTKQTHPMPNYMRVLKNNIRLKLSNEQQTQLDAWIKQNYTKTARITHKIVQLETEMAVDSMRGTNKDILMNKLEQSLKLRRELATGKIACRDTLREILTAEQWQELVE